MAVGKWGGERAERNGWGKWPGWGRRVVETGGCRVESERCGEGGRGGSTLVCAREVREESRRVKWAVAAPPCGLRLCFACCGR
eukprot:4506491-Pleurochrysis_carterae.AAC.3